MSEQKMTRSGLVWLIVSSILGAGIFGLPQALAEAGGVSACLLACVLSIFGVICLAQAYQFLYDQYDGQGYIGIIEELKNHFGIFFASLGCWGYWCSAWIGNLAYLAVISTSFRQFLAYYQIVISEFQSFCFASAVLWSCHYLLTRGNKEFSWLNSLLASLKLVLIIGVMGILTKGFSFPQLFSNRTPCAYQVLLQSTDETLRTEFFSQVAKSLLVTAWLFIGFEGGILLGHRAKRKTDVMSAVKIGLTIVCVVYISLICLIYGTLPRMRLLQLPTPSMTSLIESILGRGMGALMTLMVGVFSIGAFLAWSLFAAEIPFVCALRRLMPDSLAYQNVFEVPTNSLWLTTVTTQIGLFVGWRWRLDYNNLTVCATLAILPTYWMVAAIRRYQTKFIASSDCGYKVFYNPAKMLQKTWQGCQRSSSTSCALLYVMFLIYAGGSAWIHVLALFAAGLVVAVPAWLSEQRIGTAPMSPLS